MRIDLMAMGRLIRVTTVQAKGWKSASYVVAEHDKDAAIAILGGLIPLGAKTDRLEERPDSEWFWFQLTGRKSYGRAESLEEAKAAFRAEYEAWKGTQKSGTGWEGDGVEFMPENHR